jgi:hypothetical protein
MSQIIPEQIEHLDFEVEDPDKGSRHYQHPTIPSLRWCGEKAVRTTFMSSNGEKTASGDELNRCSRCKALLNAFGGDWYWRTHAEHFGSNCQIKNGIVYHDCGA